MKNSFFILLMSCIFVFSGCSKVLDSIVNDLTRNLVGVYVGRLVSFGYVDYDEYLQITKIADDEVEISPYNDGYCATFRAKLRRVDDGLVLTIDEQQVGGRIIWGKSQNDNPEHNGDYFREDRGFRYYIGIEEGDTQYDEVFDGVRVVD